MFLGVLGMLPSLSIDMNLPALTQIAGSLKTSDSLAAMTLSLFIFGFAGAPLVSGPVSDRFGRRPVLLLSSLTFTLAALVCSTATSISVLLVGRLFQGFGAGGCSVLINAIVRDIFEGHEARGRLSYAGTIRGFSPMIAPSIGVAILAIFSWRAIFGLHAIAGILLSLIIFFGFEESLKGNGHPMSVASLFNNYKKVLSNPISCGYSIMNGFMFGNVFAYVSNSSLVFIENLHVSREVFAMIFACTAFGIVLGATINGQLSKHRISHSVPIRSGLALVTGAALCAVLLNLNGAITFPILTLLTFASVFSIGLSSPNTAHACLEPMAEIAGAASATYLSIQSLMGSLAGTAVAYLYDHQTATAMTEVMLTCALGACAVYVCIVLPAEKRARMENEIAAPEPASMIDV
jgi:DHA1 family bicyclomycin/chloramphenicol resistance-like MFS transporter